MKRALLDFHSWEIAVAKHELYAGLRFGSESDENLVLPDLFLSFFVSPGQSGSGYFFVDSNPFLIRTLARFIVHLLINYFCLSLGFAVKLAKFMQTAEKLLISYQYLKISLDICSQFGKILSYCVSYKVFFDLSQSSGVLIWIEVSLSWEILRFP